MIRSLQVKELRIPFRQSFRHASAERRMTQGVWVEVVMASGARGCGEGCPREYVTGESIETAMTWIAKVEPMIADIDKLTTLRQWVDNHRSLIDQAPAAWCAVELALLDALARESEQSVEAMLGLPPVSATHSFSAVLGAEKQEVFEKHWQKYRQMDFRDYKVKLAGNAEDQERIAVLKANADSIDSLRFDANNLWSRPADAIHHIEALAAPAFAIEEPVAARDYAAAVEIAHATGMQIILDESLLRLEDLSPLERHPNLWIVNLRLSKMGGLLRSLQIAERARALGISLILGCQVGETSLLTRAALSLAEAQPSSAIVAREGAFGTLLLSQDIIDPPLQFGRAGVLDLRSRGFDLAHGFGIEPTPPNQG